MLRKVSRSALRGVRRPCGRFFSSSGGFCAQSYTTATALRNINTSLAPLQDSTILPGINLLLPLSPHNISKITQYHNRNPSVPLPLDALLSSIVHTISTTLTQPSIEQLDKIAAFVINAGPSIDLRTVLNYGTLVSLLPSSLYKSLPVWHRYRLFHQPRIATCSLESLSTRIDNLMAFLREMDSTKGTEEDFDSLRKIMRTDLVETITHCLKMGSGEYALAFLDYFDRQYGLAPLEDLHTWFYEALDSGCHEVISHLLQTSKLVENLPELEKGMGLLSVVQHGDIDTALKLWNREGQLTSYKASLIVQLLGANDIDQCIELIDYIQSTTSEELQINDFNFITDILKHELKAIGLERQKTLEDSRDKRDYGTPGDVKRPDIQSLLDRYAIFDKPYSDDVKSMYANLLLKTASELTNTTGVIFLYTRLPLLYFNALSYQILLRCCERGNDGSLRAFELFKFATSKNTVIPEAAYASLFKVSLSNDQEFLFYLSSYFHHYDQLSVYARHKLSSMAKYKWAPPSCQELIASVLEAPSPKTIITAKLQQLPQDFLSTYSPTEHKTHYDLRESKMLKRHHNSYAL